MTTELLTLEADPTYTIPVRVPRQGKSDAEVQITYKARDPEGMLALDKKFRDEATADLDAIKEVASGWSLADAFNDDNLTKVMKSNPGFAGAVIKAYFKEYDRVRLGN